MSTSAVLSTSGMCCSSEIPEVTELAESLHCTGVSVSVKDKTVSLSVPPSTTPALVAALLTKSGFPSTVLSSTPPPP
ncbi:hypothetical protein TeGR_g1125, partial [Tetraparma gracilis]